MIDKEFIKACKQLELRDRAQKEFGNIKELGITFEGDLLLYWFNTSTKTTKTYVYNTETGVYL